MEPLSSLEMLLLELAEGTTIEKQASIRKLGQLDAHLAAPPLLTALRTETDDQTRALIVRILGGLRHPEAIPALLEMLRHDSSPFVRHAATTALGHFSVAVEPLIATLLDPHEYEGDQPDANVVAGAASSLAQIGDPRAVEPLLASLARTNPYTRDIVVRAFGHFQDGRIYDRLEPLFTDPDVKQHWALCDTLGKLGDVRAVGPLIAETQRDDGMIRLLAIEALGKIAANSTERGESDAVPALLALLQREDYRELRQTIVEALSAWQDPRSLTPLLALLESQDAAGDVKIAVITSLGQLGDRRAVPALISHVQHSEQDEMRWQAIRALGKIGDLQALDVLIDCLNDPIGVISASACDALGQIGDARAVEPLLRALSDTDTIARTLGPLEKMPGEHLRRSAARALGLLGDPRACEALIVALRDLSPFVRIQAVGALGNIGDRLAIEPLADLTARRLSLRATPCRARPGRFWRSARGSHFDRGESPTSRDLLPAQRLRIAGSSG